MDHHLSHIECQATQGVVVGWQWPPIAVKSMGNGSIKSFDSHQPKLGLHKPKHDGSPFLLNHRKTMFFHHTSMIFQKNVTSFFNASSKELPNSTGPVPIFCTGEVKLLPPTISHAIPRGASHSQPTGANGKFDGPIMSNVYVDICWQNLHFNISNTWTKGWTTENSIKKLVSV